MKMKSAGPHPEETKVPSQGEGGTCHSPRQPATWLKGKQIKRQTGLCALYLMGTVGVWGLLACRWTFSFEAVSPAPASAAVFFSPTS